MDDAGQMVNDNIEEKGGFADFVHLRVHSAYSLSESTLHIGQLAELAQHLKMPALAITDSFNLFGAYDFSKKLPQKGSNPSSGCQ